MERMHGKAVMTQFKSLLGNILGGTEAGRTSRQIFQKCSFRTRVRGVTAGAYLLSIIAGKPQTTEIASLNLLLSQSSPLPSWRSHSTLRGTIAITASQKFVD